MSAPRTEAELVMCDIAEHLSRYTFRAASERELQSAVDVALSAAGISVEREVRAVGGRYDLVVVVAGHRIVIELKLSESAASVERQAARYAAADDVQAVMVATTSHRLAAELRRSGAALGGKPFTAVALRSF